jgi:hypothetical protein
MYDEEEVPNAKRMHVIEEEVSLLQPKSAVVPLEEEEVPVPQGPFVLVLPEEEVPLCHTPFRDSRNKASKRVPRMFKSHV